MALWKLGRRVMRRKADCPRQSHTAYKQDLQPRTLVEQGLAVLVRCCVQGKACEYR